jgi:AraC-like DNA-binding protein
MVLFVPKEVEHDDESLTAVYDTFALYPSQREVTAARRRSGGRRLSDVLLVPRSRWFSELIDRYFEARILERGSSERARFLEHELMDELLRLAGPATSSDPDDDFAGELVTRALRYIEAHLFEPLNLKSIGREVGASVASLIRHFRREVGQTPYAYLKARRLDEALLLLKSGEHQVKEIAVLVGYDDLPSFSKAFGARFGRAPSRYRFSA